MQKQLHEIRDPIHVFVRLAGHERDVVGSRAFQRLRHIHQLALTYLVYPGATHRRFEHSLGVMELASKVFDVVTRDGSVTPDVKERLPALGRKDELGYWRQVLRMAALSHDLGHLPFSHAAEKDLLPAEITHEVLTRKLIEGDSQLASIWSGMRPPLNATDIVKLALKPKEAPDLEYSPWEAVLSEIITGDAFGVDRMDYLLRDSHHAGVAYGRFDQYRLVDTMRILPPAPSDEEGADGEPCLGVEEGGIHSVEALMYARYFMFTQLYLHHVRRVYDLHLKEFLLKWLPSGKYEFSADGHLSLSDCEVSAAIRKAAQNPKDPVHRLAERLDRRKHFRRLYSRNPEDLRFGPEPGLTVAKALEKEFGDENVRYDAYTQKGGAPDFPVVMDDGEVASSLAVSQALVNLPVAAIEYVFVEPDIVEKARKWLDGNRLRILKEGEEQDDDEA